MLAIGAAPRNTGIVADGAVLGRERLMESAGHGWAGGRSVALVGDAGVGKSTVLNLLRTQVVGPDRRVLASAPAEPDTQLPFVTLIDLLAPVGEEFFGRLADASRRALDAALLKQELPVRDLDRLAVRVGVLELLRLVTVDGPVALVVDDAQWIDPASTEVLRFVVRRLAEDRLQVLVAERVSADEELRSRVWLPENTLQCVVGPLPEESLVRVVLDRTDGLLSRGVALQVCHLSAGNPFLALELADALRQRGGHLVVGEALPVPARLDALLRDRLARLPDSARDTLQVAAASVRPTLTVLRRAGCSTAVEDLCTAAAAGLADLTVAGAVVFAHPLVRAAVYAEVATVTRMRVHGRLAAAVADPIERARHEALATVMEDERVAAALTDAAVMAQRRGAADVAFELAGLAAQRTPESDLTAWAERKIVQGWYGYAAGLADEAREVAEEILVADVPARVRVRARLIAFEALGHRIGQAGDQLEAALADAADDPDLEQPVLVHQAWHHIVRGQYRLALGPATRALDLATISGDPGAELQALRALLSARSHLQLDISSTRARALRLVETTDVGGLAWLVYFDEGSHLLVEDRFGEARDMFQRALSVAANDPRHVLDSMAVLRFLTKVELRLGNCEAALAFANQYRMRQTEDSTDHLGLVCLADAEMWGGDLSRAESLARQAMAASERTGDTHSNQFLWLILVVCRLLTGDAADAVELARRADQHLGDEGLTKTRRLLRVSLVEALARTGRLAQARSALAELMPVAAGQLPRGTVAMTQRAEAVVLMSEGRLDAAAEVLERALGAQRELGTPLEELRTLLVAAEVERRRRRRGTARTLLLAAREIGVACRAKPWLERVDAELERLEASARRPADEVLTPTEERIVALVVQGATNREIATALSLGVSTVEGSLSHVYRKLGARSRVDLVRLRQTT